MIVGCNSLIVSYIFCERARDDMDVARIVMSGMWLQDGGSVSSGNSKLLMFFVGMVAVALIAQAIALFVIAVGALKAGRRALDIVDDMRTKLMPMVESTHEMLQDARPKVKIITENLVETSHVVRAKAAEFDVTASELNAKTRAQAARVDGMVTSVLNTTADISDTLQRAVKVPVREFAGLVNGFKAGLYVLVGRAKDFGRGKPNGARGRDTEW
jgi:methyl-accepting chemotaxis protein